MNPHFRNLPKRAGTLNKIAKITVLLTASTIAATAMAQSSGAAGSTSSNPSSAAPGGTSSDSKGSTSSSTANPAASATGSSSTGTTPGRSSGSMSGTTSSSPSGAAAGGSSSDSRGSTSSSTTNPAASASQGGSTGGFMGGYTMMAPGSTYIGLTAGQSKFRNNNGLGGFSSDSKGKSYGISAGSFFTPFAGLELSYRDFGDTRRAGGTTEAKAGSVSLIGKLPLNEAFSLIGRLGATYSQVDVSAQAGTGIATGRKPGWGPSYGVGAEYSFTQNVSAVLLYDEYRMPYPGGSKEKLNNTSVGVRFKF